MVVMLLAFLLAVFALPCIVMPEQVWKAFNVGDDAHDGGWNDVNLVALSAYRVPSIPRCASALARVQALTIAHNINSRG